MNDRRFPLPVSHTHAPRVVRLPLVVWIALTAFAGGFTAALYTIGFIVTAP